MGDARWAYLLDEDDFVLDTYDTRGEAVEAGMEEARDDGRFSYFVFECRPYRPEIDPERVLVRLYEEACDECDGDAVDNWLEGVTDEEEEMLGEMLNGALREWMERTDNVPFFHYPSPWEEIEVDDD